MTPDLGKLLVRPALKQWLAEHHYGWIEDYTLSSSAVVDMHASSDSHQHSMVIRVVRAIALSDLTALIYTLRGWRMTVPPDTVIAVAAPLDGITEVMRLKLVAEKVRVIVLPALMSQKQYDDWMNARMERVTE